MLEKVLDIQKIVGGQYFRVISRQEGTMEDCRELKTYYENLQEERNQDEQKIDNYAKEIWNQHMDIQKLESERDELKSKIENLKLFRDNLRDAWTDEGEYRTNPFFKRAIDVITSRVEEILGEENN